MRKLALLVSSLTLVACVAEQEATVSVPESNAALRHAQEVHLKNIRQLTFGGENAEAYFSADGKMLVFQSTRDTFQCDQIFTMGTDGSELRLVSTGKGRTTCAFFAPDGQSVIYGSTHLAGDECPAPPDFSLGYVWKVYDAFDIFRVDPDGGNLVQLTASPGYDAEAVYSHDGTKILFTSTRDGDLELYTMNPDGSEVTRLTHTIGYDGGAFFSPGDSLICWRAGRPADAAARSEYIDLLAQDLVRPADLELFVARADGRDARQVTHLGGANFCPYFTPDGKRLIFSSNHHSESGREFDLFVVGIDGTGLEQITFTPDFDGFPMFSRGGTKLVWCSNRNNSKPGETNVFIADWVE
jgi:Tol biopolymer transport system component